MMRLILILAIALGLSACAFGDEELTLTYNTEEAKVGLISEAPATTIAVADVVDSRPDRKPVGKAETADPKRPFLVGYKKNGYGQNLGNIVSAVPTSEIVQNTMVEMLQVNGHTVGADGAAATLKADMSDFWFDYKVGLVTVEFFGTVEVDVTLVDNATGDVLFEDSFTGYHSTKTGGGLSGTWTKVMDAAIADFARQMSLSSDLKDALDSVGGEMSIDTGA